MNIERIDGKIEAARAGSVAAFVGVADATASDVLTWLCIFYTLLQIVLVIIKLKKTYGGKDSASED